MKNKFLILKCADFSRDSLLIGNKNVDFLPSSKYTNSKAGYVFKLGDKGLGYYLDPYCSSNQIGAHSSSNLKSSNHSTLPGNLTRIPISIEEDEDVKSNKNLTRIPISIEDDDEEDEDVKSNKNLTRIPISIEDDDDEDGKNQDAKSNLTRIPISIDEDEEEDEDVKSSKNLTRIPISIDDDDDDEEDKKSGMIDKVRVSNEIQVLKSDKVSNSLNTEQSESFKNLGNQSMSRKNYNEAINYYTKSIEADPKNLPAYSNRALAYLEIKVVELTLESNITLFFRNFILLFF